MFFNNTVAPIVEIVVAIFMAFIFCLMVPASGVFAAVELTYSSTSKGGEWQLEWDRAVVIDVLQHDRALALNFDRSLEEVDISVLQTVFPEWIESVRYGYDSLLVYFSPTAVSQLLVKKQGFTVRMHRYVHDQKVFICSQKQLSAGMRLRYLEAIAQMELGQLNTARNHLQQLAKECPNHGDIFFVLGQLEERAGRWFIAIDQYEKAHILNHIPAGIARKRLQKHHDNQINIAAARSVEAKNASKMSEEVRVRHKVAENHRVSLALLNHEIQSGDMFPVGFPKQNKITEGHLSLESVVGARSVQVADLILLSDSMGFGLHHHYFADDAKWVVSAEINALDTTQLPRIGQEARRDIIGIEQHLHHKGALQIFYRAEAVRYHLEDIAYWAGGYTAIFDYFLDQIPLNLFDNMPFNVSARYSLDGEHARDELSLEDTPWTAFIPQSFENHHLSVLLSKTLNNDALWTLELGYAWDRLEGGEGPYQEMSVSYPWGERTAGFYIRNGRRESGATDDTVFQLEGTLQIPF